MLNNPGVTKVSATAPRQILFNVDHQVSIGVVVNDTGVTANSEGKKILKAGMPLKGDITERDTAFTTTAAADAAGILLHDVDVTNGEANGTMLVHGFVNLDRLEEDVVTALTATVTGSIPMVKFLKDN